MHADEYMTSSWRRQVSICKWISPGHGHVLVYSLPQVLVLLLQHLDLLLQVDVLFSLLEDTDDNVDNFKFFK